MYHKFLSNKFFKSGSIDPRHVIYIMDNYNDTIEQILKIDIKIDINEKHIVTKQKTKNPKYFSERKILNRIFYIRDTEIQSSTNIIL